MDLDPNNIESVSVLKGLAAANLYGTQGANGVILITTKAGSSGGVKKKNKISISAGYFFNEIASLADYQNEYGGGFDQSFGWFFSNWGPSFEEGGPAGWGNQSAIDANDFRHPYSTASPATGIPQAFPEFAGLDMIGSHTTVGNFFRTGHIKNLSVNMRGASDDGNVRITITVLLMKKDLRQVKFKEMLFLLEVVLNFKQIYIASTLNYSYTDFQTPPVAASRV